jgi:hypothetical protein
MFALLIFIGLGVGCKGSSDYSSYGAPVPAEEFKQRAVPVANVITAKETQSFDVHGIIGKVCPRGCWFYLMDDQSMIYVDLSPKDLVIPSDSEGRSAWVRGVVKGKAPDKVLEASSVLIAP